MNQVCSDHVGKMKNCNQMKIECVMLNRSEGEEMSCTDYFKGASSHLLLIAVCKPG